MSSQGEMNVLAGNVLNFILSASEEKVGSIRSMYAAFKLRFIGFNWPS